MLQLFFIHSPENRDLKVERQFTSVKVTYETLRDDEGDTLAYYDGDHWHFAGQTWTDFEIVST